MHLLLLQNRLKVGGGVDTAEGTDNTQSAGRRHSSTLLQGSQTSSARSSASSVKNETAQWKSNVTFKD